MRKLKVCFALFLSFAIAILFWMLSSMAEQPDMWAEPQNAALNSRLIQFWLAFTAVSIITSPVVLVAIVYAEVNRIRSVFYYIGCATMVWALPLAALAGPKLSTYLTTYVDWIATPFFAGIFGGLTYWIIAGRSVGASHKQNLRGTD